MFSKLLRKSGGVSCSEAKQASRVWYLGRSTVNRTLLDVFRTDFRLALALSLRSRALTKRKGPESSLLRSYTFLSVGGCSVC